MAIALAIVVPIMSLPVVYLGILWWQMASQQRREIGKLRQRARGLPNSVEEFTATDLARAADVVSEIGDLPYMAVREVPELRALWEARREIRAAADQRRETHGTHGNTDSRLAHFLGVAPHVRAQLRGYVDADRLDYVLRDSGWVGAQGFAHPYTRALALLHDAVHLWDEWDEPLPQYRAGVHEAWTGEPTDYAPEYRPHARLPGAKREVDSEELVAREVERAIRERGRREEARVA